MHVCKNTKENVKMSEVPLFPLPHQYSHILITRRNNHYHISVYFTENTYTHAGL